MRSSLVCALALSCALPAMARADTFSITGNGQSVSFSLPGTVAPSSSNSTSGLVVDGVPVDVNGVVLTTDIGFGLGGGNSFPDMFLGDGASVGDENTASGYPYYTYADGSQLFSGSVTDPTFTPGTYTIDNIVDLTFDGGLSNGDYTLAISNGASVTPEPSSLLMLGTGVLGLAGMYRRKRGIIQI